MHISREVTTGVTVFEALANLTQTAAAHGSPAPNAAVGIGPTATITGITISGGLVGVGVIHRRFDDPNGLLPLVDRLVGPLLVLLGLLAISTAVTNTLLPALAGAAVGVVVAGVFQHKADRQACADATVGAIGLHRFIEGLAIGAVTVADTTLGAATAILLACHASVESIALGSHPALTRRRAVWAVLVVQTVFVGGAVVGIMLLDTAIVSLPWLVAGIGGILLMFGWKTTGGEKLADG